MKKVVVTGAGGFLGRSLVERFLQNEDLYVTAMTSQPEKFALHKNTERLELIKPDDTSIAWERVDILVHAAFPNGSNSLLLAQGMQYHASLLEQAVLGGVGSVINISSQSIYDRKRRREAVEQDQAEPKGDYAVAKYAAELITNHICQKVPHTNIRLASLAGAGLDVRIVNKFVKQIIEGQKIHIKGGKQQFELMDVRDAADGLLCVVESNPELWKEAYNFGNSERYELQKLAECVVSTVKEYSSLNSEVLLEETDDWQNSALNSELFYREFNWKPRYSIKDTIKDILTDYMQ